MAKKNIADKVSVLKSILGWMTQTEGDARYCALESDGLKKAVLLGDSITSQHFPLSTRYLPVAGSQGFWNWANWMAGSPFDFYVNMGVSGDRAESIFDRVAFIPRDIDTVFLMAGVNDVSAFSTSGSQDQIDAEVARLQGVFTQGLTWLKREGKNVCISTITPLNSMSVSTDKRIAVLDAMNTWILTLKDQGLCNEVVDMFTVCWDNTQPTLRVFKTNYSSDGVHLTNIAGQMGGNAALSALKNMYGLAKAKSYKYNRYSPEISQISSMKTILGVSSTMTNGTGTLASGWRSIKTGATTPTFVLSNADDYAVGANYVGKNARKFNEKWQKCIITDSGADSGLRLQLTADIAVKAGDHLFAEVDILVESHTNLKNVVLNLYGYYTQGTSPVDQAFSGSSVRSGCGNNSVAGTDYALPLNTFRIHMMTEPFRIPENINNTAAVTANINVDFIFAGTGGATVYVSRPQIWRRVE